MVEQRFREGSKPAISQGQRSQISFWGYVGVEISVNLSKSRRWVEDKVAVRAKSLADLFENLVREA